MPQDQIDDAIIVALTHDVRMLTIEQIARHRWCGGDALADTTADRVQRLVGAEMLEVRELLARPELELRDPHIDWKPGEDKEPRFGAVSYQLKKRWDTVPVPTRVVSATARAAKKYGGYNKGYRVRPDEVTHDIHVGSVWMKHAGQNVEAACWIGEGRLRAERSDLLSKRVPDGILRAPGSKEPTQIIEFGGSYGTEKVRDIHQAFAAYPYVLW